MANVQLKLPACVGACKTKLAVATLESRLNATLAANTKQPVTRTVCVCQMGGWRDGYSPKSTSIVCILQTGIDVDT